MRDVVRKSAGLLLLSLGAGSLPTPALAHPHIWVTVSADLTFNDQGYVDGVNQSWTFDDGYTQFVLDGLDTNGDGVFGSAELDPVTKNNLVTLREYDFFTALRAGGVLQKVRDATDYGQIYSNGKLEMHFHVPLETPVDPRQGGVTLKIYDPDFFIDFEYAAEEPVAALGPMPSGCRLEIRPAPTGAQLDQTRAMLATKGTDWSPENGEDFGAMFARPVQVTCS
jgi:ABC-type uncharacterized transport system substrate-binding protein